MQSENKTEFNEPWGFGVIEKGCIANNGGEGTVILRFSEKEQIPIFLPRKWWRRIIATINFCAGISTEDLENNKMIIIDQEIATKIIEIEKELTPVDELSAYDYD